MLSENNGLIFSGYLFQYHDQFRLPTSMELTKVLKSSGRHAST